MQDSKSNFTVAALYHFAVMDDIEGLQTKIRKTCDDNNVMGTLLLANEGINGTIAGSADDIENVLVYLRGLPNLADLDHKLSWADTAPFPRMKVRLKKEIVTIGIPEVNPNETVGTYVNPEDWNDIISDPDVIVIDTRNDYEYAVGTFRGAIDPNTTSFREFPEYIRSKIDKNKQKKVAMFCTGGIRCEKASSFMLQEGFDEVFHLKGGILKYLETIPKEQSLWDGECFVFDQRVTVKHGLELGSYDMCHACRMPILPKDMEHKHYVQGVSCHHCHDKRSDAQKAAATEREKQIQLSRSRGEEHLGSKTA